MVSTISRRSCRAGQGSQSTTARWKAGVPQSKTVSWIPMRTTAIKPLLIARLSIARQFIIHCEFGEKETYKTFFTAIPTGCSFAPGSRLSKECAKPLWPMSSSAVRDIHWSMSICVESQREPEVLASGQSNDCSPFLGLEQPVSQPRP